MRQHDISGVPVVEGDRPVGILTARDIRFERNLDQPVSALMTKELVTVQPGVSAEEAKQLLHRHRIEKLLVVEAGSSSGSSPSKTSFRQTATLTPSRTAKVACASALRSAPGRTAATARPRSQRRASTSS